MPGRNASAETDTGLDAGLDGLAGLRLVAGLRSALVPARTMVWVIALKVRVSER